MKPMLTRNQIAFLLMLPIMVLAWGASVHPALAATAPNPNTTVLTSSCNLLYIIKNWLFNIVYVLGAIGLVIIAVSAFLGRFKFSHLIALGGGLFIVAFADFLISFVAGSNASTACSSSYTTGG